MAEKRKDNKGRVLKDGESQRKNGTYDFRYTDNYMIKTRNQLGSDGRYVLSRTRTIEPVPEGSAERALPSFCAKESNEI